MKAAVLTIGTEVTDGEITNTNASWLGSQLSELGLRVTHHLSTPDDEGLMLEALQWLAEKSDWLFVTGGLGPTSDDRTRNLVAQFLGQPLEYDEGEWQRLEKLYADRGLKLTEGHKHQCFFPAGSEKLSNPVGSALGFRCRQDELQVAVLPGPPRELKGVFQENLQTELEALHLGSGKPKTWTLLGITESEAAKKVEQIFAKQDVVLGYRASIPYVHVKVWFGSAADETRLTSFLEQELGEFVVARMGRDPLLDLVEALPKDRQLIFFDGLSAGILSERLSSVQTSMAASLQVSTAFGSDEAGAKIDSSGRGLYMQLLIKEQKVHCTFESQGQRQEKLLQVPYRLDLQSFRAKKYYTELAFQAWIEFLRAMDSTSE